MAILRAREDIEKDMEIWTRYWHKEKDAWQNIFECQCCACTNHTETTVTTLGEITERADIEDLALIEYKPKETQDPEANPISRPEPNQNCEAEEKQDYPESEIDE